MKAQSLNTFLHRGRVVTPGGIIDDNDSAISTLEKAGLVSRNLRMELVHHIPGRDLRALTPNDLPKINIGVPAWGQYYIDLACNYTIPSILMSLRQSDWNNVNFIIHTDNQEPFRDLLDNYRDLDFTVSFPNLLPMGPAPTDGRMARLPDNYWVAFKQAHRDILSFTKMGEIAVLWNSDIVCSIETFKYVQEQFMADKRVVASVGIRTEIDGNTPPLGVSSDDLFSWIWNHPHHITQECIWENGRSHHPTILFFNDELSNISMHCFHLTPMFIRKDRDLIFKGTIDDDVLGRYLPEEVAHPHHGEIAFAELSPNWKTHPFGEPLSVSNVINFWGKRMMRPHYLTNFSQRLDVRGHTKEVHPKAAEIIKSLYSIWIDGR